MISEQLDKQSNFTSLPNPSDNDLIQPWEFTVSYGLHLIKNSDNYIQDENGKTWIAACSEKKIVLKTDEALRIYLAESDYLVLAKS